MPKRKASSQPASQKEQTVTVSDTPRVRDYWSRYPVKKLFPNPSQTIQHQRNSVDANNIVARYEATGMIEHQNPHSPQYGDFSNASDYHTAMIRVRAAEADFAALPASLRAHCDNNPEKLLELLANPEARDELVKAGLSKEADALFPQGKPPASPPPANPPTEGSAPPPEAPASNASE